MPDDTTRYAATHDVPPRHAATNDSTYRLTPDAVVERLARAGVPRDLRTVQRWCKRDALDCLRDDAVGYFITELSVMRKITELGQLMELQSRRDTPRHIATRDDVAVTEPLGKISTTSSAMSRHDAPGGDMSLTKNQGMRATTAVEDLKTNDTARHVADPDALNREVVLDIFQHPYVAELKAELGIVRAKLDAQIATTQRVQEEANARLVQLIQSNQVAQSRTLADYLLRAKELFAGKPADADDMQSQS